METKQCSKCKEVKPVSEFYKDKHTKYGLRSSCKECMNKKHKKYYQENKDRISEINREYRENNKEKLSRASKEYYQNNKERLDKINKKWHQENKGKKVEYNNKWRRKRKAKDPLFKLSDNIRSLIRKYIKRNGYTKKSKTHDILGISFEGFQEHIEKQFVEGMSWGNHGEWEYDHIIPVSSANNEEEIHLLNHHLNFQPLWKKDNRDKSDKYKEEDKQAMLIKIRLWKK